MYHIITIERQYASGGNEIGRTLAKELGYHLYDHNILVEAAARLNVPARYIEDLEETSPGSIIFNLSQTALSGSSKKRNDMPLAERLFFTEKDIIEENIEKGNCIIVGRCAGYILGQRKDCLKVFIHADRSFRLQRAIDKEQIPAKDAEATLKKADKRRSSFYQTHTGLEWGLKEHFDLILDSGKLGIPSCVSLLKSLITAP